MSGKESFQAGRAARLGQAQVVFPDAQDAPTKAFEFAVHPAVAGAVGFEFAPPECAVVGRLGIVLRATVPETPVYEDRQAGRGENEVRPPEQRPAQAQPDGYIYLPDGVRIPKMLYWL
jgi:hypothetical protein